MYQIAVCDDEPKIAEFVGSRLKKEFEQNNCPVTIYKYTDVTELNRRIDRGSQYDIFFLDIDMPAMDGIEFCRQIRKKGTDSLVVFVSSKETLVFQTFEVQPFRFIRKNFFEQEVGTLCRDLIAEMEKRRGRWLRFENQSEGTVYSYNINKIVYIEARNKFCAIRTMDKTEEVRIKLSELSRLLEPYSFIQVHRSYLVNPMHIYRIEADEVVTNQQDHIPISRRRRDQIKEEYFEWNMKG